MESSNLCILGFSSFLVLMWLFSLLGFGACRDLHDKPKFTENGFHMENLLRFRFWGFHRFVLFREVLPFYIWCYPHMMDYDVSLHDLVEHFVTIPTSPRSSKTESGCKSYRSFGASVFAHPVVPPCGRKFRHLPRFWTRERQFWSQYFRTSGSSARGSEVPALGEIWP